MSGSPIPSLSCVGFIFFVPFVVKMTSRCTTMYDDGDFQ